MTLLAVVFLLSSAYAIPADSTPRQLKLKDGRVLTVSLQGDENLSWAKSVDGYTLLQTNSGEWMFAKMDDEGNMVASSIPATDPVYRTQEERVAIADIAKNLFFSAEQLEMRKQAKGEPEAKSSTFPLTGSPKLLVVLVDFPDCPFTTTNAYWDTIASHPGATLSGATGSLRDFYYDNSMGQLDLDVTVLGPCRMPQNLAYYGRQTNYGHDANVQRLVRDAMFFVDSAYTINFADYDNDNNDTLDNVHIIFAGIPQSSGGSTDAIWPHKSMLYQYNVVKDGVKVYTYSCSGEKRDSINPDGIGAMCHEFGHVLGLPDFYDTDGADLNGEGVGLGAFSLMHQGCYNNNSRTPSGLCAVEREILSWHTHTPLTDPEVITMGNLADSNVSYKLVMPNVNEYYIIENRLRRGWDRYIPAEGMLIYHVDKNVRGWSLRGSYSNTLNCNPLHQGCYIVAANGDSSYYSASTSYPSSGNDRFTYRSTPSSWSWYDFSGNNTGRSKINKPISHITVVDTHFIQFRYMLLDSFPTLNILSYSNVTSSSAVIASNLLDTQRVNVIERGICWGTSAEPVLGQGNYIADSMQGEGIYNLTMSGLSRNTHYYVRAYAINQYCTTYSATTLEFTTLSGAPLVMTRTTSDITESLAMLKGRVEDTVDAQVSSYGFYLSTSANFSEDSTDVIIASSIDNNGYFSAQATSLSEYTRYYVRAFAVNAYGEGLGTVGNFTTDFEHIENNEISGTQVYCGLEGRQPLAVDSLVGLMPEGRTAPYVYLWQQKTLEGTWVDAPNTNNGMNYVPGELADSTFFRRIVSSTGIYDTSNVVLIAINYSVGGNVSMNADTVNVGEKVGRFRIQNYKGDVVQWERKYEEGEWERINGSATSIYDTLPRQGNYYYRVKIQFQDCVPTYSSEKHLFAVGELEGIEMAEGDELELQFVPNPSTGVFFIKAATNENYNIKVLTMDGKVCYSEDNVQIANKRMDLTALSGGAYIITVSNDETVVSKKIIINKK